MTFHWPYGLPDSQLKQTDNTVLNTDKIPTPRPASQRSTWHSAKPAAVSASRTDDTAAANRRPSPSIAVVTGTTACYTAAEMMAQSAL